jgi:hypothetical protein
MAEAPTPPEVHAGQHEFLVRITTDQFHIIINGFKRLNSSKCGNAYRFNSYPGLDDSQPVYTTFPRPMQENSDKTGHATYEGFRSGQNFEDGIAVGPTINENLGFSNLKWTESEGVITSIVVDNKDVLRTDEQGLFKLFVPSGYGLNLISNGVSIFTDKQVILTDVTESVLLFAITGKLSHS